MQREAQLLRLLDAVLGSVFSTRATEGAAAEADRRQGLMQKVQEAADCARELALTGTTESAMQLVALLEPGGEDSGRQPRIEEQVEQLQAMAEQELEARLRATAPPAPMGPGMPWGDFVLESREHLANIESELLRLENTPDDSEAVHALFRSFHTIKGLAAIANTETAREVAHQTENLLDEVRSGSRGVTSGLIDLALASADFLGEVVSAAEQLDRGEAAEIPEEANVLLDRLYAAIGCPAALETEAPADAGAVVKRSGTLSVRQTSGSSVKVDTRKLDQLVDLVGELVIAQSLVQLDPTLASLGDSKTAKNLNQLGRITTELQKTAMSLRVVPVGQSFRRMARVFRDLVLESGKLATLETNGEDAELDRTIVEQLADPLMHMVRNAVDHGLEKPADREKAGKPPEGRIRLSATHQSGHVVIEVSDDGRGLDQERILRKAIERGLVKEQVQLTPAETLELIFEPGFSTSEQVTAISGRGVGMDVVKREIEKLRGRVEVRSEPGKGTTFLLRVPLTLAIIDALVVKHGNNRFILPLFTVREILKPGGQTINTVEGRNEVALLRDRVVPVLRMEALLGESVLSLRDGRARPTEELVLVVVEAGPRRVALAVDEVVGKQEVVIKSLGDWMGRVRGVAGGAILGDGSVGIILDLDGLMGKDGYGLAA
jgi:two-component system, chemotaxis family, sensor kinase CheA